MSTTLTREQRLAMQSQGYVFPDPRDQELFDRGRELSWHQHIARNCLAQGRHVDGQPISRTRRL
jgi:hypothetical protein